MKFKTKAILMIVSLLVVMLAIKAYIGATHILTEKAVSEFDANSSTSIYNAIDEIVTNNSEFGELFTIIYDSQGDISFISTDSFKVNLLAKNLAVKSLKYYEDFSKKGVYVPIGAFTGVNMLSGLGKQVKLKLINVVSAKCEFVSTFEQAGINQTRQTLYLEVTTNYSIVTLLNTINKVQTVRVLVYDNLIVGKVPSTYLTSTIIGKSG